jgi:hypothetical protein
MTQKRSPTEAFDWGWEDRYRSNHGKGPYMARVLAVSNGEVQMERWDTRQGKRAKHTRFMLRLSYLTGPTCGWKRTR